MKGVKVITKKSEISNESRKYSLQPIRRSDHESASYTEVSKNEHKHIMNMCEEFEDPDQEQNNKTQINPTFILKHIDIDLIKENYFKGMYRDIRPPDAKIENRELNKIFISNLPENEFQGASYKFTNKVGEDIIIRTVNHKAFLRSIDDLNHTDEGLEKQCYNCGWQFTWSSVGLVERYSRYEDEDGHVWHIFWITVSFCTFNCYKKFIQEERKKGTSTYYTEEHVNLMKILFGKCHPSSEWDDVCASGEKDMLIIHEGWMNHEEFIAKSYMYTRMPKVVCINAKIQYLEDS